MVRQLDRLGRGTVAPRDRTGLDRGRDNPFRPGGSKLTGFEQPNTDLSAIHDQVAETEPEDEYGYLIRPPQPATQKEAGLSSRVLESLRPNCRSFSDWPAMCFENICKTCYIGS